MPKSLAIRQLLDCPEKEFWERIFGSEDFNHYLYEGLGFEYELQEWNRETGYRRAKIWPTHQMPRAVARVLRRTVQLHRRGNVRRRSRALRLSCHHIDGDRPDSSQGHGDGRGGFSSSMRAARDSRNRRRRVGLGRLIETYFVSTTREQYAKNAALVNEYLANLR